MATNHNSSHVVPPCSSLLLGARLLEAGSSQQPREWNNKQAIATSVFYCTQTGRREVNRALGFITNWWLPLLCCTQIKKINKPIYISKTIQSNIIVQGADNGLMFFSSRLLAKVKVFLDVTQSHYNLLFKPWSMKNTGPSAVPSGLEPRNI